MVKSDLLTAKEACRYLRVSMFTLSKIESEGGLVPYRTPGGHRRYTLRMLDWYFRYSILAHGDENLKSFVLWYRQHGGADFFKITTPAAQAAAKTLIEAGLAIRLDEDLRLTDG